MWQELGWAQHRKDWHLSILLHIWSALIYPRVQPWVTHSFSASLLPIGALKGVKDPPLLVRLWSPHSLLETAMGAGGRNLVLTRSWFLLPFNSLPRPQPGHAPIRPRPLWLGHTPPARPLQPERRGRCAVTLGPVQTPAVKPMRRWICPPVGFSSRCVTIKYAQRASNAKDKDQNNKQEKRKLRKQRQWVDRKKLQKTQQNSNILREIWEDTTSPKQQEVIYKEPSKHKNASVEMEKKKK